MHLTGEFYAIQMVYNPIQAISTVPHTIHNARHNGRILHQTLDIAQHGGRKQL